MTAAKKKKKRDRKSKQKPGRRSLDSVQKRSYARIKRRLEGGPLGDHQVVVVPQGQVKMSEVLEDFVEPYLDEVDESMETHQKLFSLAVVAWNAALLSKEQRKQTIDEFVEAALRDLPARDKREFRALVDEMVKRKLTHFAEYKRAVIDFELTDMGTRYHLTVVSTMSK